MVKCEVQESSEIHQPSLMAEDDAQCPVSSSEFSRM